MIVMNVVTERKTNNVICRNEPYKVERPQTQNRRYSVQTCKVTYGGVDGAYYTSTRTRRAGSDGVSEILCAIDFIATYFILFHV